MAELNLDRKKTALLIGDIYAPMADTLPHARERRILDKIQSLQKAARAAGILVCYSATVFRPGYLEISDNNKSLSWRRRSGEPAASDPLKLIHTSITPREGEVVVAKRRTSPFYGTDLDMVLRANGIETLIILGIMTGGMVLSAVRYAADLDCRVLVVEDCCADGEPQVHDFLMQRIFPPLADVVGSDEVIRALQ